MKTFSQQEIATAAGISTAMLRKYIQHGVFPHAEGSGRGRYYTPHHLKLARELCEDVAARRAHTLPNLRRRFNGPRIIKVNP